MEDRILSGAWRLWRALEDIGSLNLWEARAILGETREFTCDVLLLLASQGKIRYYPVNDQLFIAPAEHLHTFPAAPALQGSAG